LFHAAIFLLLTPSGDAPVELAQLSIEQRVIIRVPLARPLRAPPPAAVEWEEKKGPRCVAIRSIRQAAITSRNGVDLILSNSHRYRARMNKGCRSADFFSGFYLEPSGDGSLCAGRDNIQSRSGMECEIVSFKRLVPDE
jgi:hypothetical protein